MTLDWELIRQIVLAVENSSTPGVPIIERHSRDEVDDHAHLLIEMRLAQGYSTRDQGHQYRHDVIANLTSAGHEFAEFARDQNRGDAAMSVLARRGTVTLDSVKQILANPEILRQATQFAHLDPELGQISITTNKKLVFLEFHGGRKLNIDIDGPQTPHSAAIDELVEALYQLLVEIPANHSSPVDSTCLRAAHE